MKKRIPACVQRYRWNMDWHNGNPRGFKRFMRRGDDPVYEAHNLGQFHGMHRMPARCSLPPGKRRDAYLNAYAAALEDEQHWSDQRAPY